MHDGPGAFSPLLGIFSGLINASPNPGNPQLDYAPEILTSSNVAYVHFYSDAAYNMTGFSITYSADYCDTGGWDSYYTFTWKLRKPASFKCYL